MKFTLRDLLAVVFLLALGLLAWRTWDDTRRQQAQLAELKAELKELQARLRTDSPGIHAAILRTREEHRALAALRDRSLEHFRALQEKYRAIETRGPDVLSLRTVPSIPTADGPAPIVFRLIVPLERTVWLKFARRAGSDSLHSSKSLDEDSSLLSEALPAAGPYQLPLPAGDQTLQVTFEHQAEDSMPFRIKLGKRLLLESSLTATNAQSSSRSSIAASTQIDFPARRELPWLLTVRLSPSGQSDVTSAGAFSMWLSDRSSDFEVFPEQ